MSVHVISDVLRYSKAEAGARLVLIVLADHADGDGSNSFPSVETIAREARLSERAAQYALRKLEKIGEIKAKGKSKWGTTVYSILLDGGAKSAPGGVQNETEIVSQIAPKPSFNPSNYIERLFEFWKTETGRNGRTRLTPERKSKLAARLKQGYSEEDLRAAIRGCARSDFHRERGFTDLTLICRNGSKVEQFRDLDPGERGDGFDDLVDRPV